MYINKNIIVIFLFIMLSFAIISEVSAGSDAKTYGMEFNSSAESVTMTQHDLTDKFDNNHNLADEDKFQNQHGSFKNYSQFDEELNGDSGDCPDNLSIVHDCHDDDKFFDGEFPIDFNFTDGDKVQNKHMPINFNFSINDPVGDLSDSTSIIVPNAELMNNVISDLMGLNNIAPNLKKYDKFD